MASKSNANAGESAVNTKEKPKRLSTSEMVMESIRLLNWSNGVTLEALKAFIEEFYEGDINSIAKEIDGSLEIGVKEGILEQAVEDGGGVRFKLKETTRSAMETSSKVEEIPKKPVKRKHPDSDSNSNSADAKRNRPYLPQMVVESIKSLKMRRGAPVDAICRHMEEHYGVNVKDVAPNLKKFLKVGVERGVLENAGKVGANERFKVKSEEGIRKRKVPTD